MNTTTGAMPIAVFAGHGILPALLVAAATEAGRQPIVFAIDGEADPAGFAGGPVHTLRWGEVGRLFRLMQNAGCHEAVFIGGIRRRPRLASLRPDFGAIRLLPQFVRLLRGGDDTLLRGVAAIFRERGVELVSPLDIAPGLAAPAGLLAGRCSQEARRNLALAAAAARDVGHRDIGQGAVAIGGRVVATEGADGTAAMLARIAAQRRTGSFADPGGVLVKCMKPRQDPRLDLPTIGPDTAREARAAGLEGVAVEAGRSLLAGRAETIEAFRASGLFLYGMQEMTLI